MINTLVSDDHDVVRQGLRIYLGLDPELRIGHKAHKIEGCASALC